MTEAAERSKYHPEGALPREKRAFTREEIAAIAPVNPDGKPDMLNHMPTRFVPYDEAKVQEWPYFFEGAICRYGHQSTRFVSNPRLCVDCFRIKRGKTPIGTVKHAAEWKAPARAPRDTKPAEQRPVIIQPTTSVAEPDRLEKKFLENYAACKGFEQAASLSNISAAHMHARLAWSEPFRNACAELESRLGIRRSIPPPVDFDWTDDKRERFLTVYVDTGERATARDSIGCTMTQFQKEIQNNPEFGAAVESAEELADLALEERAVQLALLGNDKVLLKVLSAKNAKYRDNIRVDMNVSEKNLSADQLRAEILRLVKAGHGRIIDGEFAEVIASGAPKALPNPEREEPAREPESNIDLL